VRWSPSTAPAEGPLTDQQGRHVQRAVPGHPQLDVVDLAHRLVVAVDDLAVQQVEGDQHVSHPRSG
jgi:hypothetical protein